MTKKIISLVMVCALATASVFASSKTTANKETQQWRYEIECAGNGAQGSYLVKVWSYSKKQATAQNQAVKNAVHGVIFKGVPANGNGCTSQRPLANNPSIEYDKAEFFKAFFADGGDYAKYASATNSVETTKVGKEYKVGVVVSVSKDALRKALEAAGVIKGLGSGF